MMFTVEDNIVYLDCVRKSCRKLGSRESGVCCLLFIWLTCEAPLVKLSSK